MTKYYCHICFQYALDPLNCTNCKFFACKKCFILYKAATGKNKCITCQADVPKRLVIFLSEREDSETQNPVYVTCKVPNCAS